METFASSKTMNNQSSRFSFLQAGTAAGAPSRPRLGLDADTPHFPRAQGQAQSGGDRIPVTLSDPSRPAHVKVSLVNGGITVKAYDGKQVVVEAHVRNRENSRNEGGPKRLAISTTGLTIEEENNEVSINTESYARTIDLTISVPVHTSLKLRAINDGDVVVTGVEGEIDVDDINGAVDLKDVSGSVVAHALNGHVRANFVRVTPQKAMAFSSLNGDIDVTFPADLKANVSIRSDRGDVFSDFDVQLRAASNEPTVEDSRGKGGKYRVKIHNTVHGTINGGGPDIQITYFQDQTHILKAT